MNTNHRRMAVAVILCTAFCPALKSQVNNAKFEIGVGAGVFNYQGDLTPSRFGSIRTMRPGINLFVAKIISASLSVRTNLAVGGLRGNDALYVNPEYRRQRNFNFRSPVIELSQLVVWNPLKKNYEDKGFSPYLFTGIGISFLNIRRDWSNYNAEYFDPVSEVSSQLVIDAAHSLPKIIPVIPAGAGIRYGLSPRIALSSEISYRFLNTDYLDGFSKSVNPERNDHYYTIMIGAVYRIGRKNRLNCPVFRN